MPISSTEGAPKFDGKAENLMLFIEEYEYLADQAGLLGADRIKGLLRYVPMKDRGLWAGTMAASTSNYATFVLGIKKMYPGCQGDKCYAVADLQTILHNQFNVPMRSVDAEGEYYCKFIKVAQPLVAKDRIGKAEMNRLFLEGFPTEIQQKIRTRLLIKSPDHHPDDPYPIDDVHEAADFSLPGVEVVEAIPSSAPSFASNLITPPQAPAHQQPAPGTIIKQEYQAGRSSNYTASGCVFCGNRDHFIGRCQEKELYINVGKCKIHDQHKKIVLPNGRWAANEALPSASVTAGIFTADSEVDDEDLEVLRATQALALATAKCDQKKGNGPYAPKGKASLLPYKLRQTKARRQNAQKALRRPLLSAAKPKETPKVSESASSSSVNTPLASSLSTHYRNLCALEDKEADKRIIERLLQSSINIPVCELLAVSPDVRKQFRDLTTNKCVTVGTVSVNELSSQEMTEEFMQAFNQDQLRSDDGKVVADHFVPIALLRLEGGYSPVSSIKAPK
ncbi:hypothetical protein DFJ58DRAFT_723939 [Suillus subalutaceus]|uniref:uncharacterized protein n=1 Tax=Suillus subalutaceus TaxID=48586 RepID=UPI001B86BB15|nr:uncharacterized protein DFJ58DRAFT_723939 [Suillus subalutaceus]KAG1867265.1 hypothetical protein DFJ58DRAFT_723939 [Suillus subalutaceus]